MPSRLSPLDRKRLDIARLRRELADCLAVGDEYHAAVIEDELTVAQSLARLVHRKKKGCCGR